MVNNGNDYNFAKDLLVYDYDALNKPEHQKLKQLKKAEKYNI